MADYKIDSFMTSDTHNFDGIEYEVGTDGIEKLTYHTPVGEGDTHYVDITYTSGKTIRYFCIDRVIFSKCEVSL